MNDGLVFTSSSARVIEGHFTWEFTFKVVVESNQEGGFSSYLEGVSGANSQGDTPEDAAANAIAAWHELMAYRQEKAAQVKR